MVRNLVIVLLLVLLFSLGGDWHDTDENYFACIIRRDANGIELAHRFKGFKLVEFGPDVYTEHVINYVTIRRTGVIDWNERKQTIVIFLSKRYVFARDCTIHGVRLYMPGDKLFGTLRAYNVYIVGDFHYCEYVYLTWDETDFRPEYWFRKRAENAFDPERSST